MIKLRTVLIAVGLAAVAAFFVPSQWGVWRTGRVALAPLSMVAGDPAVARPGRIWIDTDAACGATARTDPDDCLAILWLVSRRADIAGLSTSFGNAPGDVVEDRVAALMGHVARLDRPVSPVFRGYGKRSTAGDPLPPGVVAMQAALEAGPLTILALGPLTNVAAALKSRPDLQRNVTRIVAVMGHRPGHTFHPTEGKGSGALMLGHGPIFRDLNVAVDPKVVATVLAMHLPMTLIPYDAARTTLITATDLDSLARHGPAHRWVVQSARGWLTFWNDEIGLPGFYPFDWIAAAYLTNPDLFECANVTARMTQEWTFWLVPHAGLVVETPSSLAASSGSTVQYCPQTSGALHDVLTTP